MQKLIELFHGLSKRGKILAAFATIIIVIAVVELFTGCSNLGFTKTWSF
jgi:hypothetical protein